MVDSTEVGPSPAPSATRGNASADVATRPSASEINPPAEAATLPSASEANPSADSENRTVPSEPGARTAIKIETREELERYMDYLRNFVPSATALLYTLYGTSRTVVQLLRHEHASNSSSVSFLTLVGILYRQSIERLDWGMRIRDLSSIPSHIPRYLERHIRIEEANLSMVMEILVHTTQRVNEVLHNRRLQLQQRQQREQQQRERAEQQPPSPPVYRRLPNGQLVLVVGGRIPGRSNATLRIPPLPTSPVYRLRRPYRLRRRSQ